MTRLTIVNGPHKGEKLGLVAADVVIGRDAGCDLVLPHDWVSRRHCRLFQRDNGWMIEDFGSCNGLCVNGVRVEGTTRLSPDDLVAIGPLVLRFEVDRRGAETRAEAETASDGEPSDVETVAPGLSAVGGVAAAGAGPESEPFRVALAPDARFAVTLAAVLKSKQEITQHGKVTLRSLARRGTLAADAAFDGRLSGQFGRRQFLILDAYDLTGSASSTLRAGLLLPKNTRCRRREWAYADVQCRIEYPLSIPGASGRSVLDSSIQVHLGRSTCTIWAAEGQADPDATGRLTSWGSAPGRQLPFDVPPQALSGRLTELCKAYIAAERGMDRSSLSLSDVLKQHCLEAAELYRRWYHRKWHEQTQSHDSQLPVGEMYYEFDAQGKQTDQPRARVLSSVYRWV